jgi:nucleotidyltransferase/DNA polymerase involved in DNA repair
MPSYGSVEMRTIFHLDMDAFFASVEIVRNPQLKGKPVIVGGQPNTRGVVSTCSYEARVFGVRSAMSLTEAYRRCPHGIFLNGDFSTYRKFSQKIMEILSHYTPNIEVVSVDEAYIDVSEIAESYGGALNLGEDMRKSIFRITQLPCSIGIATNKLIAKIASSKAKPNGILHVLPGEEISFLAPLAIQSIPGIGTKTQELLNRDGILLIKDLQEMGMDALIQHYGSSGYFFHFAANGQDDRPIVSEESDPKSIGHETTFDRDEENKEILIQTLQELVIKTTKRLCKYKMRARGVSLKLRFSNFRTITRSHLFCNHTQDAKLILKEILYLFEKNYIENTPIRLIGVTLEKLTNGYWQPSLWDKPTCD